MVKFFLMIKLLVLFVKILNIGSCEGSGYEVSECLGRLTEHEINEGDHCCLLTGEPKSASYQSNQCVDINSESFENFDGIMNYYNEYYDNLSIDCISYYFNISIHFLLILFLLI